MNKVVHAAQLAAFSAAIDVAINAVRGKGTEKLSENAVKLVNLAEPLLKDRYPASAFDAARKFVSDPNGKWMQCACEWSVKPKSPKFWLPFFSSSFTSALCLMSW